MDLQPLPLQAALADYEAQAEGLLAAHRARHAGALDLIRRLLPRYRAEGVPWLPSEVAAAEVAAEAVIDGALATLESLLARDPDLVRARLDLEDKIFKGTPMGWAQHGGHAELALRLVRAGG